MSTIGWIRRHAPVMLNQMHHVLHARRMLSEQLEILVLTQRLHDGRHWRAHQFRLLLLPCWNVRLDELHASREPRTPLVDTLVEHIVPHEQAFADKLGDREPIEDVDVLLPRRIQDRSQLLSVGFVRRHLATSSNIAAESAVQLKVVST